MADGTADTRNWFLRISSGTIFGPVSTQGLITWAEQGRVQAGNAISPDRKNWQPAESLPALNITWYVEDVAGQLVGPFHKRAAEKIVAEGRATGETKLVAAADADLSRLRKPAAGKREGGPREDHLELDLDPAASNARDAAETSPAAWLEERESLRLRIAELEEQGQQVLRAAEKESKTLSRQVDAARRQITNLERALEELKLAPPDPGPKPEDDEAAAEKLALEEALEAARQAADDARQAAERETDTLNSRIFELEQQLAAAATEDDAAGALESIHAEHEKQRVRMAELEQKLAEQGALREQLDQQATQLARQTDELEILRSEHDKYKTARQDVEALKVRIAELVGQMADHAADAEAIGDLGKKCAKLEESLRKGRDSYSELLEFSNSRDGALQQDMQQAEAARAELQARLDAAEASVRVQAEKLADATAQEPVRIRELSARLREKETLLAGVLAEEQRAMGQVLATERESFTTLRDSSLQRQNILQARLTAIQKLQGGETTDVYEREAKVRTDKANSAKTQDALIALQQEHARHLRQSETRERELVSRVRMLELEEERLKTRAAEAEPLYQRNQHLTELLNDREQKLAQERQQRSIEQEQLEQAHQALIAQIESRKQADNVLPLKASGPGHADAPRLPAPQTFRVAPWMRLKK